MGKSVVASALVVVAMTLASPAEPQRFGQQKPKGPALLQDYLTPDAVAFIEWPAAAEPWLENVTRRVEIRHTGGDEREIDIA